MLLGVLSLALSFISFTSALASVSDCGKGTSLFTVKSMSFSPDPPVVGENSTLLLSMDVPEEINSGTATYSTTLNFIPFTPTVDPLCDTTVPCPIQVGQLDTVSSYPFPSGVTGALTIKIQWADSTGRSLMCVQIKSNIGITSNMTYSMEDEMCPTYLMKQLVVYKKPRTYLRGA